MYKKLIFSLVLVIASPFILYAQNNGSISGKIVEISTGQPLEFVTVVLMKAGSDGVLKQEVTNAKGIYKFTTVADGTYYLIASYIGFKNYKTANLTLGDNQRKLNHDISLDGGTKSLNEVVVTSKKQLYSNSIDRKIYNVDQDIMAKSGSASEVLQNVPLVQVDIDGNVSLRNSSATILINGKVSPIMGKNAAAALQQLPANSIARIEVITNPSAKYKPDGTGGIINIVLKKNTKRGLNGGVTANVGNQERYNASVNANYHPGKVNLFGSYSIKQDDRLRLTTNNRTQTDPATNTSNYYKDNISAKTRPFSNTATLGMDYAIDSNNSIGISGNYYLRTMHKHDFTLKNVSNNSGLISDYDRTRTNYEYEREVDGTFFFEHNFKKEEHKIRLELNASHSPEVEDNHYVNAYRVPAGANQLDNTLIKQTQDNKQLTVSYENPIAENTKLELGYDGQYNRQDLDFYGEAYNYSQQKFIADALKTNRFIYNENIHAFYGTIEQSWKKFGAMLGLRGEFSDINSHLITTTVTIPNHYFKVYPTLHLTYNLSDSRELQLNYSRRVHRPEGDDLNPFAEYADPTNIRVGNPHLLPEIIHSVELGYQWKNNDFTILPGIYYRYKYNGFTSITAPLNSTTLITTQQNLANDKAIGADVVFSANINDKLFINLTPNAFYNQIDASNLGYSAKKNTFTWSANFNSSYSISKSATIQVNSNYRSARLTPQGKYLPSFVFNFGLRKDILQKKGSLYFTMSDVFKTQRQEAELSSPLLTQHVITKSNSRIGYLGISYNFGVVKKKKELTFDNSL
ncbi:outer membrane beta-barrel family protein [Pedobacter boryungensis]|uniref:TonB-dependent receptor n=1 Tax=Pedobacter boryungensis TaxID=869962 RepID=A0ABX2DBU7_9SPHI|nr:outer membrane beta-barrel family protein [Pedobacter boryungensis]NQX31282.1 TonB-dependent receptor [Pedobacter boryungensis]